jgi:hypothetical protein
MLMITMMVMLVLYTCLVLSEARGGTTYSYLHLGLTHIPLSLELPLFYFLDLYDWKCLLGW